MTGTSDYIGSIVVKQAIPTGYLVHATLRAVPADGDLQSYGIPRKQSAQTDVVLHETMPG